MSALAPLLEAFFTDRLIGQRDASPNTISGYRDTFRLLLRFAAERTSKKPSVLDIADLDAPLIGAFLTHLEHERGNRARTRNNRLAAIHSLFSYAALRHPEHAATIQRVLAIPAKRYERRLVTWLTGTELDALLAAPDRTTWAGRRDHAMLVLAGQTGLRISELTGLTIDDVHLQAGAYVHCLGKGRKERATPLTPHTVEVLRVWLRERGGTDTDPLFPTRTGSRLSRDAVEHRLARHLNAARMTCPSLRTKHVGMHTLRHTAAMRLLESGTDVTIIALWLGHEQPATTTQIYLHADMSQKQKAIARVAPPGTPPGHYRPPDPLLAFLEAL
ncbi:tyrosine-type recombinase/integrase [Leifsonia sp. Root112D2]|uniref:tyrosine-type recombinase/integrase n=1 Tax=Leifsonia sp. Root112D2 TaxID=1736426 RepID=UPI0006FD8D14|nr:tyrosine-type recombinase/integrase [Leifsonia sp. Root112D2]KQV06426.1 integrase [Leifsonia sp. Root112D2]